MNATYFHGGKPGRKRGEFILPPCITKSPSCSEYGADVRGRRIQGRKVMTEAITILQSVVIYAGDLMLCIGALVFLWLVAMESGL